MILSILAAAFLVGLPALMLACLFLCHDDEKKKEEARTDMHIRVTRELNAAKRKEQEAPCDGVVVLLKKIGIK